MYQLLYYLYYLKQKGIDDLTGVINYTKAKRKVNVELTGEKETEVERIISQIQQIIQLPNPPEAEETKICKKCSYGELCWS